MEIRNTYAARAEGIAEGIADGQGLVYVHWPLDLAARHNFAGTSEDDLYRTVEGLPIGARLLDAWVEAMPLFERQHEPGLGWVTRETGCTFEVVFVYAHRDFAPVASGALIPEHKVRFRAESNIRRAWQLHAMLAAHQAEAEMDAARAALSTSAERAS